MRCSVLRLNSEQAVKIVNFTIQIFFRKFSGKTIALSLSFCKIPPNAANISRKRTHGGLPMLRPILIFLGCILLLAAVGKVSLLLTDPFADLKTGYPSFVVAIVACVEIAMFAVLFSKLHLSLVWLIYLLFFLILAAVSGLRRLLGVDSCYCFGVISIPFVAIFAIDLCTILSLLNSRPKFVVLPTFVILQKRLKNHMGVGCAISLLLLICYFTILKESPGIKRPLKDHDIVFQNSSNILDDETVEVVVFNPTFLPILIVGSQTSCSCVTTLNQRVKIPSRGSATLTIRISRKKGIASSQRALFYIDHPDQTVFRVNLIPGPSYH